MTRITFSESEILRYYESRVPKLKKSAKELRGPCPIHKGTRDSLAINLETGQWFCHSTCNRGGNMFQFESEISGTDKKTARDAVLAAVEPKRRVVATYDYHDENGQVLFQVVRTDPKNFWQQRPNGHGGWITNMNGVRRVLYRLPAVIAAPIVFIAEGEKDCNALTELGVTATCNVGGAMKWKDEYGEFLRGKEVFVIPDADEKGHAHAADVMQSLAGVAASVRLVELPGAKDAAEWIERGGTIEELMRLAERQEDEATENSKEATNVLSGAELLKQVEQYIRRYLILPDAAYLPVALWVVATHAVLRFDCFPYLAIVSAVKRSGKTRLAEVLEKLVRRPWHGAAPSPAALYRMLEGAPTLLLDEIEVLNSKNKSETTQILLAVLNAGHRKGATIPRCEPPKWEIQYFEVYGPKLFAAIGRLPDTLMDRSIVIRMKRRSKGQKVKRFRQARATAAARPIHDGAARFAETHRVDIDAAYEYALDMDLDFLNDRDADIWTPLFVMCAIAIPERVDELKSCALTLSAAKAGDDADDSYSLTLLRDVREVWPEREDKCETAVLLDKLKALEESPWTEYQLTGRKLARMLKPFEVEPRNIQVDTRRPKGYRFDDFKDAFDRYLDAGNRCNENSRGAS